MREAGGVGVAGDGVVPADGAGGAVAEAQEAFFEVG